MTDRVRMQLEDGILLVPRDYIEAVAEEYADRNGTLTVSQAQVLIEKWAKPPKVGA